MPIINIQSSQVGLASVLPSIAYIDTSDTEAQVLTTGYLNTAVNKNLISFTLPCLAVVSTRTTPTATPSVGTFQVVNSGGNWSLITTSSPGNVVLPTVVGDFPQFNDTLGELIDNGKSASDNTKTKVVMATAATTLNNIAMFTDTAGTIGNILKANGTEAANAVTASGKAGVITTSSLSTAGAGSYAITWTNTQISATSSIQLTLMGGTNTTKNITIQATAGVGTSTLTIYNNTASTALDGTLLIGYVVI